MNGTQQEIGVITNPPGATVSDGKNKNIVLTPTTLNLERGSDYVLTIEKPGFEAETIKINRVLSDAVVEIILPGGIIGWGIDALNGSQWNLEPEAISVNLRPLIAQNTDQELSKNDTLQDTLITEEIHQALIGFCLKTVAL